MALRGTLLILTGISWLTVAMSVQSIPNMCNSIQQMLTDMNDNGGPAMCKIFSAELYVEITLQTSSHMTITYICNRTTCNLISPSMTTAEYQTSSCNTISITTTTINTMEECNTTTYSLCTTILPQQATSLSTHASTITTTITPSFSPTTAENSKTPAGTHGGYIAVILVLLAIIITLVVLVGYLVRRTTAQRGTVQTTEQPPIDMAATAGDYCEPIALRQLQTSTEPEVYSEPADTLNRLHSATNRQGTPSCHVNPFYEGAPSCQVNPSYEGTPVNNGYSVLQQRPSSHPPLPDPPTDDSNTEYSKPVEMDNLPPLAENDYEVLEEVRREKERTPEKLE